MESIHYYSLIRLPSHSKYRDRISIAEIGDCVDEEDYRSQYVLNKGGHPYKFKNERQAIIKLNQICHISQIDPKYVIPEYHKKYDNL